MYDSPKFENKARGLELSLLLLEGSKYGCLVHETKAEKKKEKEYVVDYCGDQVRETDFLFIKKQAQTMKSGFATFKL